MSFFVENPSTEFKQEYTADINKAVIIHIWQCAC
jgi:hypothetical protein